MRYVQLYVTTGFAALALSIVSWPLSYVAMWLGVTSGLFAIVLGYKSFRVQHPQRWWGLAGLLLGLCYLLFVTIGMCAARSVMSSLLG